MFPLPCWAGGSAPVGTAPTVWPLNLARPPAGGRSASCGPLPALSSPPGLHRLSWSSSHFPCQLGWEGTRLRRVSCACPCCGGTAPPCLQWVPITPGLTLRPSAPAQPGASAQVQASPSPDRPTGSLAPPTCLGQRSLPGMGTSPGPLAQVGVPTGCSWSPSVSPLCPKLHDLGGLSPPDCEPGEGRSGAGLAATVYPAASTGHAE